MNIFGMDIPWSLILFIIVLFVLLLILTAIQAIKNQIRNSGFHLLYHFIRKALKEEPLDKMDFKEYRIDDDIKKIDPNFNQDTFLKTVENVLRQYCKAFSENEYRLLLSFETPALFQRHKTQIIQNEKNKVKDIHQLHRILGAKFVGVRPAQKKVTAEVVADMGRYKINQNGVLVSGSKSDIRKRTYVMTFYKAAETEEAVEKGVNCPNCGAPHTIHSAGICEYCGSMIVALKDNWLLDDLKQM